MAVPREGSSSPATSTTTCTGGCAAASRASRVQGTRKAWPALKADLEAALWASLATDQPQPVGFALTSQVAFGACEPVAATLTHRATRRHVEPAAAPVSFRGVSVDVGPRETVVRVLLASQPEVRDPLGCRYVLGRDHGYRDTVSWTLVRVPETGISQAAFDLAARINAMTDVDAAKAEARAYLEAHASDAEPALQATMPGRGFLDAVAGHCSRIDTLRREIDRVYDRVRRLKHEVNAALGVAGDALVNLEAMHDDRKLSRWVARLGRLLAAVAKLKEKRRAAYRAFDGLKRSWFGHLANVEVELAREHDALVVHERLTTSPLEVDAPEYKGRTFNRMMANGSRARFERVTALKHRWQGNPVVAVPSYFTSTTDHRHAVVDAAQRKGEWFTARADARRSDSDAHASHTLAVWPVMLAKVMTDEGGAKDDGALPLAA